jgi:hypothetical protein
MSTANRRGAAMIVELLLRFLIGGAIVCAFSVISEVIKPQSYAGIFGAAPSVALATLGLTFVLKPAPYVAKEGHAMLAGAVALCTYCAFVGWLFLHFKHHPILEATVPWLLWFAIAFGLWGAFLR